jgi:hypothetical protein
LLSPIEGDPLQLPHRGVGPFAQGLPLLELAPGKSKPFYFPYEAGSFLSEPLVRIGVQDTYGRNAGRALRWTAGANERDDLAIDGRGGWW